MEFSVGSEAIGSKTIPTPSATEGNPIPVNEDSKIISKRTRNVTSNVWHYFEKTVDNDGKEKAQCKGCGNSYAAGGNKYETSTLQRRLGKCKHVPKLADSEVGKLILDHNAKLKSRKVDQRVVRDIIAMAIIEHDLPFSFVEYRRIRELIKYANPDIKIYSRRVTTMDVIDMYKREKRKLKEVMRRAPSRICLTSDVWTSCTTDGYISLTAHFVDENWKLNSKILNFAPFPPPHSGIELARTVFEFLQDWGIDQKVFSLTVDNASSNDNMQEMLKERHIVQNNGLLCGGEFFHVRCCAHILNLIVQEGLKVATGALHKIRESIKYVRGSEARMNAFKACVQEIGGVDTNVGLRMDVPTRWNSSYSMLESALPYRRVFSTFGLHDTKYKYCPTSDEWKRAEKLCQFFKPFYEITTLISGSSYPTSNLYFMQVWKIECLLHENLLNEDDVLREMCGRMKVKFDKYWSDYSVVLAIANVLDPRMNFTFLEYCYKKLGLDPTSYQAKLKVVRVKLYALFNEYVKRSSRESSSSLTHHQNNAELQPPQFAPNVDSFESNVPQGVMDEFIEYGNQTVEACGRSQLDIYLDDPRLLTKYHPKLDVLQYWNENKIRFPDLALLACDILSIPITTVASESAFSIGSRVLNKYRKYVIMHVLGSM